MDAVSVSLTAENSDPLSKNSCSGSGSTNGTNGSRLTLSGLLERWVAAGGIVMENLEMFLYEEDD